MKKSTGSASSSSSTGFCLGIAGSSIIGVSITLGGKEPVIEGVRREAFAAAAGVAGAFPDERLIGEKAEAVAKALGFSGGDVYVSIADSLVNTLILDFDALPADADEEEKLVYWRAARGTHLSPEECRVGYCVVDRAKNRVAASVIRNAEAEALEGALSKSGFGVKKISVASICAVNAMSGRFVAEKTSAVVAASEDGVAALIFRDGSLDFYRFKHVAPGQIGNELYSSFTFYAGKNPDARIERVYALCLGGGDEAGFLAAAADASGAPVEKIGFNIAGIKARGSVSPEDEAAALCAAGAAF